ncbi:MAG: hypothetical protein HFF56_02160 [Lawsonibacter sp.]|nr:hypothetical protein [Lawsonibacter sp.]MCI8810588.1 hypothetical protein [Oscillibacter sp.]
MDWKELQAAIEEENDRILGAPPEDILRVFKFDIMNTGAGTEGLMLGPDFEGATAIRYIGGYYVYNIIKLGSIPSYTTEQIKELANTLLPKAVSTVRLCGMKTYADFAQGVLGSLKTMDDKQDILSLLNSLYLYGSSMNGWYHHYMKWGLGQAFRIPSKEELLEMGSRNIESFVR